MANKAGKNSGVKWNALDLTPYLDKISIDRIIDLIETTVMSTSNPVFASRIAGLQDFKIAVSGKWDPDIETTVGFETDAYAGTARTVKTQLDTTGAASTSNPSYSASMLADGFKLEVDVKGAAMWSANFMIASSVVTRATSGAW